MSSPKKYIFAPIEFFKKVFPLVIILALLIVLLLSAIQIRKITQPIEELRLGSKRLAEQEFNSSVNISSGDEFEELGQVFNEMSRRLGNQFHALTSMSEINRAILSSLNTKEVIDFLIFGIKDYFNYNLVKVSLFDPDKQEQAWIYSQNKSLENETIERLVKLPINRLKADIGEKRITLFHKDKDLPGYFLPLLEERIKTVAILPLFIKEKLSGVIILGTRDPAVFSKDSLTQARQLANQVAVALSNAKLIEDLDKLNWGTLYALARAVDAKSQWTGNHSERVLEMAAKIGKVMKLSEEELDNLRRGALLHDIGKIGIPLSILDKKYVLSEHELMKIQEHPEIGARILEPISVYSPVIPIILQHHERFDGTGYPNGLSGDEISIGARILSVADVYDALGSDRPYRSAIKNENILDSIFKESGKQFDPKVVEALKKVVGSTDTSGENRPKTRMIRGLRVEEN